MITGVQTESDAELYRLAKHSLRHRHISPELMDDPGLDRSEHLRALAVLSKINLLSSTGHYLGNEIGRMLNPAPGQTFRILDVACGGGDIVFSMQKFLKRRDIQAQVDGCDISPVAIDLASCEAKQLGIHASFFQMDALRDPLPEGYHLFISSLFLHHLADQEIAPFLKRMANSAERGFIISDLERCRFGYLLALLASRVLTRSIVVRTDSLHSVRAALTLRELETCMIDAGLGSGRRVARCFPFRLMLSWRKC